jgi:hypothetical protein
MIRVSPCLILLVWGATSAAQQTVTQPDDSAAARLVGRLADDASWQDSAVRLVLMRGRAAAPLAAALTAAATRRDNKLAGRILTVLDRIGMDAGAAADALWNAIEHLDIERAGAALRAAPRIAGLGGVNPKERVASLDWARHGADRFARQIRAFLSPTLLRLRCKHQLAPGTSIEQLLARLRTPTREDSFATVQALGARGKAAAAALPELVRQLTTLHRKALRLHGRQDTTEYGQDLADAILHIDPTSPAAATAYGYLLNKDRLHGMRRHAARELMMLGPHVPQAAGFLLEFLRGKPADPGLTCSVINGITMLGWQAEWAIPSLEGLVDSEEPRIAARAKSALRRIKGAKHQR